MLKIETKFVIDQEKKTIDSKLTSLDLVNIKTKEIVAKFPFDISECNLVENDGEVYSLIGEDCEKYPGISLDLNAEFRWAKALDKEMKESLRAATINRKSINS